MVKTLKNEKIKNYFFTLECKSTKNGFKHIATLYNQFNTYFLHVASVNYLNRTWECYEGQTTFLKCINELIEMQQNKIKDNYKQQNNIKRITQKHNEILNNLYNSDATLKDYYMIKSEIKGY